MVISQCAAVNCHNINRFLNLKIHLPCGLLSSGCVEICKPPGDLGHFKKFKCIFTVPQCYAVKLLHIFYACLFPGLQRSDLWTEAFVVM